MKILIVDTYAAIRSTGKITNLQYQFLKSKGHDVRVCYRGIREPKINNSDFMPVADNLEPYFGRVMAMVSGYEGFVHPLATKRVKKITAEFKPYVVQLNLLHGYFINSSEYIQFLKEKGVAVCYTMLDEYAYMGKCPFSFSCNKFIDGCDGGCPNIRNYPTSLFFDRSKYIFEKKQEAYKDFEKIVFTGPGWVAERARKSALLRNHRVVELDEPVNFQGVFYPRNTEKLRSELGIPIHNKIIVTVAQLLDPRKGGKYVFEVAKKLEDRKDITFVYVGCDAKPPFEVANLIKIPFVKSQDELATYYSLGDLFICTSLADTMPNVCIDAMGCGTPLAGFAEAGTPYVAPPEIGTFTPTYDIEALAKVILEAPKKDKNRILQCHNYAETRYAPSVILSKLEKLYYELVDKKINYDNPLSFNRKQSLQFY